MMLYDMPYDCENQLWIKKIIVEKECSCGNKKATDKVKFVVVIKFIWYIIAIFNSLKSYL